MLQKLLESMTFRTLALLYKFHGMIDMMSISTDEGTSNIISIISVNKVMQGRPVVDLAGIGNDAYQNRTN